MTQWSEECHMVEGDWRRQDCRRRWASQSVVPTAYTPTLIRWLTHLTPHLPSHHFLCFNIFPVPLCWRSFILSFQVQMKYCFPQDVFPISLKHHWLSFSFWDHPLFVFLLYLEYSHCTLVNYMCFISLSIFWSPREQGACPIHLCISKATQHRAGIQ